MSVLLPHSGFLRDVATCQDTIRSLNFGTRVSDSSLTSQLRGDIVPLNLPISPELHMPESTVQAGE